MARILPGGRADGASGAFVSDIFREVDEEVRREQLQKLWDRYQNWIIAGAVLIVLAVAAWRGYDWWATKKAMEAGSAFEEAIVLSEGGKHAEAESAFAKIASDSTAGYRNLARLRQAAELAQTDPKGAIAAYEAIASDSSVPAPLRDLAGIRAGALLIDHGTAAEAAKQLEPLAAADRPFRHTARELLALAAWRSNNAAEAKRWFDIIATDAQTPAGTRSRVEMLMALLPTENKG
jgi:hypothetical protein